MRLALVLALASKPPVLSPEAAEHNKKAMVFYDAGQLGPAVDEFFAAYQSMPDPRRDQEGRQLLLGSMSMTLRGLHDITHEAAPLCRLRTILQDHADALPREPSDAAELAAVHRHLEEVTRLLAAYDPRACEPPPPVREPTPEATPARAPVPSPSLPPAAQPHAAPPLPASSDERVMRTRKLAGGATLGVGVALLGGVVGGIVVQHEQRARAREFDARQPDRYITRAESDELRTHLARAQFGRGLAVGTGLAAGVLIATGTALLVLARRPARARRWSAAPWWSTAGAGVTVHVRLGATR